MYKQAWMVVAAFAVIASTYGPASLAQGSKADYESADALFDRFRNKVTQTRMQSLWVVDPAAFPEMVTAELWHRITPGGDGRWMATDVWTGAVREAFDHDKLAAQLSEKSGKRVSPDRLPIQKLTANTDVMRFEAFDQRWEYRPATNTLTDPKANGNAEVFGPAGMRKGIAPHPVSYDRKWRIDIQDHNVVLLPLGEDGKLTDRPPITLTTDGTADNRYTGAGYWSPDDSKLVVMRRQAGDTRHVTIVDTAPDDQLQPKTDRYFYLKPGDKVPIDRPVLFDLKTMQRIEVTHELAENPYHLRGMRWKLDSSAFIYEYNQRGHQVYRVIEIDATTGRSRAVISEETQTFFTYSQNKFFYPLDQTNEMLWLSERDGWNHLYLYDWKSGQVKRQLTHGQWVVREVERVDRKNRTVWFWAGGIHADQDPYHLHYCRVDMDSGKVTPLTASDGTHTEASVSACGKYLATTWSRVDHPPVHELRSAETGELIKELGRGDASKLIDAGWIAPERFVAKGRDGQTAIYGIIIKPTHFDPGKTYPVIEQIYAGPHGQHVPKRFYGVHRNMQLAELGFIIVQIDGMGTNHRSKAFHDVAWKNLKDAGFPDRIAWMKAAAKTRPWMDLSSVGIYGGSAGGQNAMRAVLDHHDFYKAAAADCGCHDNRMDKIWWNEQWMGYPVDESYAKSSNVVDAHKLRGALLLTVGELDRNVDPASTMQVVDALIKADIDFELMVLTGGGHGAGESKYGRRLRADFFVRHLMNKTPRWE